MVIYKYPLKFVDSQIVNLPSVRRLLRISTQDLTQAMAWYLVDANSGTDTVKVKMVGTGWEFDSDNHEYLGTVDNGPFVWHFFGVI